MCTAWQRFGRAARLKELTGIALLLVEPKYFDDEREKRAQAKEKRAAKRAQKKKGRPGAGVHVARDPAMAQVQDSGILLAQDASEGAGRSGVVGNSDGEEDEDEDSSSDEDAYNDERRAAYSKPKVIAGVKRKREDELEPAMDDMINAGLRKKIKCHRRPPKLYFGNDKTSMYILNLLLASIAHTLRTYKLRTIWNAIQTCLAAVNDAQSWTPSSAVSSVPQRPLSSLRESTYPNRNLPSSDPG